MDRDHIKITERERDVLICLSFGMNLSNVASFLDIHRKTASYYKNSIMKRLGFRKTALLLEWLRTESARELIYYN
ncbi:hypothetical protein GST23_25805 [Serratia marcescens]|uniref:LuxR C-terminal-related transcriptional regulator n=2 Tax=Serratia marcescens TaxID=615 RepID=UPI00132A22DC|nr:hypothetical protein [Serratia marcescens]QHJ28258.1 hypothetical protein GV243_21635 [Serratia marcescens]